MRCKDIERLMIDGSDRTLSSQERDAIESHVSRCSSCARFQEDLHKMRKSLDSVPCPGPSEKLLVETLSLCRAEMEVMKAAASGKVQEDRSGPVPRYIWAAVFSLLALTGILIISTFPGFDFGESMSLKTILFFTLIAQNAAMLFFAPVLIQKFRSQRSGYDPNGYENLVP